MDTSVLNKPRIFNRLCLAAFENGHRVRVPSLVHAERLFQLRRRFGADYRSDDINALFQQFAEVLDVEPLDKQRAEEVAMEMGNRWDNDERWMAEKRAAYCKCLGNPAVEPGTHRPCGAPVDLYLAALATPQRPIITDDGGREWDGAPAGAILTIAEAMKRLTTPCPS